jgi:hypothetical protein
MRYTFQMGSGAMIYISHFIKTVSDIQTLIHRQRGDSISLFYFVK